MAFQLRNFNAFKDQDIEKVNLANLKVGDRLINQALAIIFIGPNFIKYQIDIKKGKQTYKAGFYLSDECNIRSSLIFPLPHRR